MNMPSFSIVLPLTVLLWIPNTCSAKECKFGECCAWHTHLWMRYCCTRDRSSVGNVQTFAVPVKTDQSALCLPVDHSLSSVFCIQIKEICNRELSFTCIPVDPRPYYVRPQQPTIVSEPMDKAVHREVLRSMITIECVVQIQSIISGWWPHIYWRHNGSVVNSTWPAMARIDTNFWNFSELHTPFPGSYQCVVDDGSFVLVSREAQISLLCKCCGRLRMLASVSE